MTTFIGVKRIVKRATVLHWVERSEIENSENNALTWQRETAWGYGNTKTRIKKVANIDRGWMMYLFPLSMPIAYATSIGTWT